MDNYCEGFKGGKCKYANKHVPRSWCYNVCRGKYSPFPAPDANSQYCIETGGLTSVIIACRNEELLNRTIDNVQKNAAGNIEFIIVLDGGCDVEYLSVDGYDLDGDGVIKQDNITVLKYSKAVGRRVAINRACKLAGGEYMLHIDAHCTMSKGWDAQLKTDCGQKDMLVCRLYSIDTNMKRKNNRVFEFGRITPSFKTNWWLQYRRRVGDKRLAETMSFQGCGWFLHSDYWHKLGGFMEHLTHWGYNGSELACLVWLHEKHPGRILLHRDVYCGHYFRKQFPYKFTWKQKVNTLTLKERYGDKLKSLAQKFAPVPDWHFDSKKKEVPKEEQQRRLEICRTDECGRYSDRKSRARCGKGCCGAFLDVLTKWQDSKCPQGHW